MNEIEDRIQKLQKLQDLIDTQAQDGNWNYDPYMHGMLNGLILSRSVFDDELPDFKDAPKQWIDDLKTLEKFNKSGIVIK